MLDHRFIRENVDLVRENIRNRHAKADVDSFVTLYDNRNALIQQVEQLRSRRNSNAKEMKQPMDNDRRQQLIEEGKQIKAQIAEAEEKLRSVETELRDCAEAIPNMTHPDAPVGAEDTDNHEIERVGSIPELPQDALDHVGIGRKLDLVDFETASQVSGPKFYYLRNQAVLLQLALERYALDVVSRHGFTPTITPDIAKTDVVQGIGFNPRGPESNIYNLEGEDSSLVGTAEITLGGYYAGQTIEVDDLPIKLAGLSHCFRKEAGAAGQFSKGLYRVHQFSKVEMFVYSHPDTSDRYHREMLEIEKEIFAGLEIPFRVVDVCTGDLGGPAYRKYDLEAWMPGRGENGDWGEITSTSNCTDYQARRLNIRFQEKTQDGKKRRGYVHLLNGTAVAVSRAIIAILENNQKSDGSVLMPKVLQPYLGFERIPPLGG